MRRLPGAAVCLLLGLTACKAKNDATTAASASASAEPAVALPKGVEIDPKATVQMPALERLIAKQTFELAGSVMTMELCRLDAATPPIANTDHTLARVAVAAAADGTLWVLDNEKKLRHYVKRSPRGCELVLDRAFGSQGVLDTAAASDGTKFSSVSVDAKGVVYVSGDKTRKLVDGKLVEHCSAEWFRTAPNTKLAIFNRTTVTRDGACDGSSVTFKGYDPSAPDYARPRAIGFLDDEIVVKGVDMEGKNEVTKVGAHSIDGTQRFKVGSRTGDEAMSPDLATKCGDDICLFSQSLGNVNLTRVTRAGKFAERISLAIDGFREGSLAAAGDGNLWINGAASTKNKGEYTSVIMLVRAATSAAVRVAVPAEPRGDEPPHDKIAGPIKGTHRGRPLLASKVTFEYRSGNWRLVVHNGRGSHLSTQLLTPPATGAASISRAAGPKANSNSFLTSSENKGSSHDLVGSAVHWISIDRWDVVPYDAAKGPSQDAGYASGRVWIDMPHTAENGAVENSLASGEFEDAVITYFDDPAAVKKE